MSQTEMAASARVTLSKPEQRGLLGQRQAFALGDVLATLRTTWAGTSGFQNIDRGGSVLRFGGESAAPKPGSPDSRRRTPALVSAGGPPWSNRLPAVIAQGVTLPQPGAMGSPLAVRRHSPGAVPSGCGPSSWPSSRHRRPARPQDRRPDAPAKGDAVGLGGPIGDRGEMVVVTGLLISAR